MKKLTIKSWAIEDRPREKLLTRGADVLTDAELLAIFLRTGIKGKTAVDLARDILKDSGGLRNLLGADEGQFCKSKGIEFNDTDFNKDIKYITSLLKAYIAKEYFNSKGWYSVLISEDDQVQKSLELLNDAKKMLLDSKN